jgi:excisionase family DNA binding protein
VEHTDTARRYAGSKGRVRPLTEPQQWMTVAEAMAYLRVSRVTLYRLMGEGRLPFFTIHGERGRRLRRADLDNVLLPGSPEPGKAAAA